VNKDDELPLVPDETRTDLALDAVSAAVSMVPWLGGPLSAVLSGASFGRRIDRVKEVVTTLAIQLQNFKSEASEQYVKTDEFHELFEKALRSAAEERNEDKRRIYRDFIVNAIRQPSQSPYDERVRILRVIEDLDLDHIRVLRAIAQEPGPIDPHGIGSPSQTLAGRVGGIPMERIEELVHELNSRRITKLERLRVTMTARGATDLRTDITTLGRQVLDMIGETS
jgi:hypothetical protein